MPQPLTPLIWLNMINADGTSLRTDSIYLHTKVGTGIGASSPEHYMAYNPANTADTTPIQAGQDIVLTSRKTGQFCKLSALPPALLTAIGAPSGCDLSGLYCNVATAGEATRLRYTGSGLQYQGVALRIDYKNRTLLWGASSSCWPEDTSGLVAFLPAMKGECVRVPCVVPVAAMGSVLMCAGSATSRKPAVQWHAPSFDDQTRGCTSLEWHAASWCGVLALGTCLRRLSAALVGTLPSPAALPPAPRHPLLFVLPLSPHKLQHLQPQPGWVPAAWRTVPAACLLPAACGLRPGARCLRPAACCPPPAA